MGKYLRKIADQLPPQRIVFFARQPNFFAEQPDVANTHDTLEKPFGIRIDVGKSKAAGENTPLSGFQAIRGAVRIVTHDEAIDEQALLDASRVLRTHWSTWHWWNV